MPELRECECPNCYGEGWVQLTPNEGEAPEDATTRCSDCKGTGKVEAVVLQDAAFWAEEDRRAYGDYCQEIEAEERGMRGRRA